jgi:hypothetical protein
MRKHKVPQDGMRRYLYDIWQPVTLLIVTISFTAAFFATYDPRASTGENDQFFFCNSNGNIETTNYSYEPFWDPRLYFTVNIPFGEFSFSTAKIIDAAWDAIIGRGGQIIMALIAFPTLRRSLTLTMETCTVTIPCVVSLCGQQIHLGLVGQLVHTMIWHWNSSHPIWRRPFHTGRARFGLQVFVCIYLLTFSTLVSVMSGYRAQLTGYFGYDANEIGQLYPINQLLPARLTMYDADRVNLRDEHMVAHDEIVYPGTAINPDTSQWSSNPGSYFVTALLANSRDFEEPYGTLVDCW